MDRAEESRYLAYMLRLWSAGPGPEPAWRASVQSVTTGERRSFGSLGALFEYLVRETSCGGNVQPQTGVSARGSGHIPADARNTGDGEAHAGSQRCAREVRNEAAQDSALGAGALPQRDPFSSGAGRGEQRGAL